MQVGTELTGFELASSPRRLNSSLHELRPLLEQRDRIQVRYLANGTGSSRIELQRMEEHCPGNDTNSINSINGL